jgi:hypothetical protein
MVYAFPSNLWEIYEPNIWPLLFVLVCFLSLWWNNWDKQLKRKKGLFLLTVLVHGHLAMVTFRKAAHLIATKKRGKRERGNMVPISASRSCSQWSNFFPLGPSYWKFLLPPNSTISWEPSLQHMSFWGTFKIQTMTLFYIDKVIWSLSISLTRL